MHRGCGVADFDGDGRLDIGVLALGDRAELWKNDSATTNRWLIVKLVGTKSNRDGIGARVVVGNQVRTMTTALGYASSSHAGVHFGLGGTAKAVRVEVQWPSGVKQIVEGVETNRVIEIRERRSRSLASGFSPASSVDLEVPTRTSELPRLDRGAKAPRLAQFGGHRYFGGVIVRCAEAALRSCAAR